MDRDVHYFDHDKFFFFLEVSPGLLSDATTSVSRSMINHEDTFELLEFNFLKIFAAIINNIIFVLHAYVACIHVHALLRWFIWFDFYIHLLKVQMHLMTMCSKATTIDGSFPPAWVGIGNAYAAQGEGDQAMAAFRSGARLFPG
ncbi:hypothetical protein BHE74_00034074 [Ensete ventricosum]|nr:hypothetical protein GW17_00046779 [Ensete ventricosum]RWW59015.1 hypothetical protein BHE74_00034074 [Ensete ventricosum]